MKIVRQDRQSDSGPMCGAGMRVEKFLDGLGRSLDRALYHGGRAASAALEGVLQLFTQRSDIFSLATQDIVKLRGRDSREYAADTRKLVHQQIG